MGSATPRRRRVACTGTVPVPRPPEQAIELFTAEGERAWVSGWDPRYPDPDTRDVTAVGAVWQTAHEHGHATWIVTDRQPTSVRYAMVVEGLVAGTVAVSCAAGRQGSSAATISYDMTALSAAGADHIDALAAGFEARMHAWGRRLADVPADLPVDVRTPRSPDRGGPGRMRGSA